jgi:chloramphenicol-sensitive protein RarD
MSQASTEATGDLRLRHGAAYALAAYTFWGFAPIYFVWVNFAAPLEILAHRVVWSVPLLACLITLARQWPAVRLLTTRQLGLLGVSSTLLSVNWLTFIYAIHQARITETSLGYFINPLVSIVLGALFLGERLRPLQWLAAGAAAVGVASELIALGQLPWLGLTLAFSFGFYGLLRKQLQIPSSVGLGVETLMVVPLAVAYLAYGASADILPARETAQVLMLGLGGLVTVTPLVWFAAAAVRMPLTLLSFFQYLAPSLSLLLAVFVYAEPIANARWLSFALIWLGLAVFSVDGLRQQRGRN